MKSALHYSSYLLFLGLSRIVSLLPLGSLPGVAAVVGNVLKSFFRLRRSLIETNIRLSFPDYSPTARKSLIDTIYYHTAILFIETLRLSTIRDSASALELVDIELPDEIKAYLKKGTGGVVVSGHFSNWEVMALSWGYLLFPFAIVYKRIRNPYLDRLLNQWRTQSGNAMIEMMDASRLGIQAIREGKFVALLSDQSGPEDGLYSLFLGRPAPIFSGAALFALRTKTPIIVAIPIRQPNHKLKIKFSFIDTSELRFCKEHVEMLTLRYTAIIEEVIKQYPEQWFWLHNRWKHSTKAPYASVSTVG